MSHPLRLGILGAGVMGSLIARQLKSANIPQLTLRVCDPNLEKIERLKALGIQAIAQAETLLLESDVILFAMKPQQFRAWIPTLNILPLRDKKIISIMAGISFSELARLGDSLPCIRAMPNTPAQIGLGASGLLANTQVDSAFKSLACQIFDCLGKTAWLTSESQLNALTALSGSGVAYFFFLMEIMEKVGIDLGLPPEISKAFTLQTAVGAAQLAAASSLPFDQLRTQVTSKGGTTEAALTILQNQDFHGIMHTAMLAAMQRAEALGDQHD